MVKKQLENRYWLWTVLWDEIYHIMPSWKKVIKVLCKCDCWTERFVQKQHLTTWLSASCWCEKDRKSSERAKITSRKHGMEWTIPYRKFMSAKARCENPSNPSYKNYWWRWIKVIWKDFAEFWKDMWPSYNQHVSEHWLKDTTLDRIDYNWNYCKENCRWATWNIQYNNMSTNRAVVYKWKQYPSIAELADKKKVPYWLLRDRIRYWWSVEDAVDLPKWTIRHVKKKGRKERDYL